MWHCPPPDLFWAICSVIRAIACAVPLFFLNPYCVGLYWLVFDRKFLSLLLIILSKILPGTSRREMGLKFWGSLGDLLGFGINFIVDSFHFVGKYPAESIALNMLVRLFIAISGNSFSMVLFMPLSPGHVFFIFFYFLCDSLWFYVGCECWVCVKSFWV